MHRKVIRYQGEAHKYSLFDYVFEFIGWLQIFASPFLAAVLISALIYFSHPTTVRFLFAIVVLLIGIVVGIVLATKVYKTKGTIHFVSRVVATPELDKEQDT